MTIKELAAKKAKEAALKASQDVVVTGDAKAQAEAQAAEKAKELNEKFYTALAERDTKALKELQEEIKSQYSEKGQSVGTDADGGYLVPTTLDTQIREKLKVISPVRQIATVISNLAADLEIPFEDALPTVYWVAEGVAPTESKSTFVTKKLVPKKLGGFGKFTHESLVDTASNPSLQSFVADRFAMAVALKETDAFVNGDGTDRPYGFRSSAITPNSIAQAGASLAYGDLVKLMFGVNAAYRGRGVFATSTAGLAKLVGLTDTTGRPLFVPSLAEGQPSTLLGRPIYEISEIPSNLGAGTNETEIWFGDFKNYIIGDREGTRIAFGTTGNDLEQDKISLVIFKRVAGLPTVGEAFAKLTAVK